MDNRPPTPTGQSDAVPPPAAMFEFIPYEREPDSVRAQRTRVRSTAMKNTLRWRKEAQRRRSETDAGESSARAAVDLVGQAEAKRKLAYALIKKATTMQLLSDAPAYQDAIAAMWIENFFPPRCEGSRPTTDIIADWRLCTSDASTAACDAIGLLVVAATSSDKAILALARGRLLTGISKFKQMVEQPRRPPLREVLTTAQSLIFCEIYATASSGVSNYSHHLRGVSALCLLHSENNAMPQFAAFLTKTLDAFMVSRSWLYLPHLPLNLIQLSHGLAYRQVNPIASFRQPCRDSGDPIGPDGLLVLGLSIPPLLQQSDTIKQATSGPIDDVSVVVDHIRRHLTKTQQWMTNSTQQGAIHVPEVLDRLPSTPEGSWLTNFGHTSIIQGPVRFISFLESSCHILYHVCVLLLAEVLMDMSALEGTLNHTTASSLASTMDGCADMLCRSVPYVAVNAGAAACQAMACRSPLHYAKRWYSRSGQASKVQWCTQVEDHFRNQAPFLEWELLLPWGLFTVPWLS
ncbi:hypothetical protein ANO11243_066690 [Dothideomycetidae sp. 11243]|nr:hypothetical protein ANO11243_066690 [fungal sp. No.11243]